MDSVKDWKWSLSKYIGSKKIEGDNPGTTKGWIAAAREICWICSIEEAESCRALREFRDEIL